MTETNAAAPAPPPRGYGNEPARHPEAWARFLHLSSQLGLAVVPEDRRTWLSWWNWYLTGLMDGGGKKLPEVR